MSLLASCTVGTGVADPLRFNCASHLAALVIECCTIPATYNLRLSSRERARSPIRADATGFCSMGWTFPVHRVFTIFSAESG
jgi:hypothetical protein